jgi:hypothetical protein
MARWPDFDMEQSHRSASEKTDLEARQQSFASGTLSERNPTDSNNYANVTTDLLKPETPERSTEQRSKHDGRFRSHSLRSSEIRTLSDIGKFRVVDRKDLGRVAYPDNETQLAQDIRSLQSRGLIQERTIYRAHRPSRQILTLTGRGQRTLRTRGYVPEEQQLYYGLIKPKEIDHDADLYKVYQKEAENIQRQGGKIIRVRLDSELKSAVYRDRNAAGKLPELQRKAWLKGVTEQQGLSMQGGTILMPDIQIEYETVEGTLAKANLELVSENYRGDAIRSKAGAGFKVYVRAGDSTRVKRALHDSGAVEEILSL